MHTTTTILLSFTISLAHSWSTFDKTDKSYIDGFYEKSYRPIKECEDERSEEACKKFKDSCFKVDMITKLCRKTCNDCPAVSPMSCHATKYGCCWDGVTKAGPRAEDCPKCVDTGEACSKMRHLCKKDVNIRRHCPVTCGVEKCGVPCYDDPTQAEFCDYFAGEGFCDLDPALMRKICRKTCKFCGGKDPVYKYKPVIPSLIQNDVQENEKKNNDVSPIIAQLRSEIQESKRKIERQEKTGDKDDSLNLIDLIEKEIEEKKKEGSL